MPNRFKLPPLDIEVPVNPKREILSETDSVGVTIYANDYFVELSGYPEEELVGKPHSVVRHPDTPKVVFKLLWNALHSGKAYKAIVKNRRKDGKYYWVYSEYVPLFNEHKALRGYRSKRHPVPKKTVTDVGALYKKLLEIETTKGMRDAELFLEMKLDQGGFSDYSAYVEDLYTKKFRSLFGIFGKLFGTK